VLPSYPALSGAFRLFVQRLDLPWHKPQRANLIMLATAFARERSLPVRRLARAVAGPGRGHRHLDKRIRRFLGNPKLDREGALAAYLRFLLPRFSSEPFVPVMLDWTYLHRERSILWCQIPYRGRAFPLFALAFRWGEGPAGREGADAAAKKQTAAELQLLNTLAGCWPADAPRPLLLADRGFPKPELLTWLHAQKWYFLIRGCVNQHLSTVNGRRLTPASTPEGETPYYPNVFCFPARVPVHVVTATRRHKGRLAHWRLLTNLPVSCLPEATRLYRHRMQPEQTHRDCKSGHFVSGFALGHLTRMNPERIQDLLFCVGLWYAFLILLAENGAGNPRVADQPSLGAVAHHLWARPGAISGAGLKESNQAGPRLC
jgi:hypothetical protein